MPPIKCRHEVRFCASLVYVNNAVLIPRLFKAFFSVRPQVMMGQLLGRGCATHPVRSLRGSRDISILSRRSAQRNSRSSYYASVV